MSGSFTNSYNPYDDGSTPTRYKYDYATGLLGANTQIDFTYTVTVGKKGWGTRTMEGLFDGITPPNSLFEVTDSGFSSEKDLGDGLFSFIGTLTLKNYSPDAATFFSFFSSNKDGLTVMTEYSATKLASVPLPAALPLFAAGVAGLAGLKRMRKRQSVA